MPTKTIYPQAGIRISSEIAPNLEPYGVSESPSRAMASFLNYALQALEASRAELSVSFTPQELRYISAAMQGTFIEPSIVPHLAQEVAEWEPDSEWPVNGQDVAARISRLSAGARWALADRLLRMQG